MSPNQRSTDNLLRRYLNGALTGPEEAELERRALADESLAEAMQGLQAHPEANHEAHVARMLKEARSQVQGRVGGAKIRPIRRNYARFAAAASVVILFVSCALWFLPQWIEMNPGDMAMKARTEAPVATSPKPAPKDQAQLDVLIEEPTSSAEPETEPTSSAPPSPTPNLRPRPDETPTTKIKAEATARKRAEAAAKQNETARRQPAAEGRIAADEVMAAEEIVAIEAAPPPAQPIAPAKVSAPKPSVEADQTAGLFEAEASLADDAAGQSGSAGDYLEGRITNENGVPIFSALVRLPGLPLGERTDSSGYFRLPADATTTRIEISHPDYEDETVDLNGRPESLQVSLDRKEWQPDNRAKLSQGAASSLIILDNKPGYAAPLEGYGTLRKRLEAGRPANLPKGKVKFSFTVNTDGTLTDFEFRGQPGQAIMDYIGETIVRTSVWEIMQGEEPVRVYMKVVF